MCPEKLQLLCCSLFLRTVTTTATVRDSCQYSNDLLQGGLEDRLLCFFIYGRLLAEIDAVITNSTFMQGNLWYINSLYILKQRHFPIAMWHKENDMYIKSRNYYWWIKCWQFCLIITNVYPSPIFHLIR